MGESLPVGTTRRLEAVGQMALLNRLVHSMVGYGL
jgi:hypothetical protein